MRKRFVLTFSMRAPDANGVRGVHALNGTSLPTLMIKATRSAVALLSVLATLPAASFALNPVIQTMYTADPAPIVHKGTLYLFSGHDEEAGKIGNVNMKNWVLATTTDMVNWAARRDRLAPGFSLGRQGDLRLGRF
jgi:hypothetical protein